MFFCKVTAQNPSPMNIAKEKAEKGDMVAQYQYATMLSDDKVLPEEDDYQKAIIWLRKSAEQGYAPAQTKLGYWFDRGYGVKKNSEQAVYWYRKAAEQGDENGLFNLAICYQKGEGGLSKSESESFMLFKKSAEQGYSSAQFALGRCYYYGTGTEKNYNDAFNWFNKAADKGHVKAMYVLGWCYAHGQGVSKNLNKAIEFYEKASAENNPDAEYELALIYLGKNDDIIEKDSLLAAELLLDSAAGGEYTPYLVFTFGLHEEPNKKALDKLLELSNLSNSPNQYYFLAITGCHYWGMKNFKQAESYFKKSIELGGLQGTIELGLMYFYVLANSPQYLDFMSQNEESNFVDCLDLESYRYYEDDSACINYLNTKQWTENDNVAYWLEKAVDYKCGGFIYGMESYNIYNHLLFVYINNIGSQRNFEKALKIIYTCLTDREKEQNMNDEYLIDKSIHIIAKNMKNNENLKLFYENLYNYVNNNPESSDFCKKLAYSGIGQSFYKDKNYNSAFKYLSEAMEYESEDYVSSETLRYLAACYRFGRGTNKNAQKEQEFQKKAESLDKELKERMYEFRKRYKQ